MDFANCHPTDLAKKEFFVFIKSALGNDLLEMLHLDGQPSPHMWGAYADWWIKSKTEFDNDNSKVSN